MALSERSRGKSGDDAAFDWLRRNMCMQMVKRYVIFLVDVSLFFFFFLKTSHFYFAFPKQKRIQIWLHIWPLTNDIIFLHPAEDLSPSFSFPFSFVNVSDPKKENYKSMRKCKHKDATERPLPVQWFSLLHSAVLSSFTQEEWQEYIREMTAVEGGGVMISFHWIFS